jgi:hypothetical protein
MVFACGMRTATVHITQAKLLSSGRIGKYELFGYQVTTKDLNQVLVTVFSKAARRLGEE